MIHYIDYETCKKCPNPCCTRCPGAYSVRDIKRLFPAEKLEDSVLLALSNQNDSYKLV